MKSIDWITTIDASGHLPMPIRQQLADTLKRMAGQRIKVTLSEVLKERSLQQNRYYWGVVIARIKDWMDSHGNRYTKEDIHEFMKTKAVPCYKELVDPGGEVHDIPMSTTELSTLEFEDYLEGCRHWAAQRDLQIPLPNEEE